MFVLTAVVAAFASTALAVSAPINYCNTAEFICCRNIYDPTSTTAIEAAGQLGTSIPNIPGSVGINCYPIVEPVTASDIVSFCPWRPVCCYNYQPGGAISFGCVTPLGL